MPSKRVQTSLACLALFALNALFCWRLFRVEYLENVASNEGTFITFGKFVLDHWPHIGWFPLFNAGMPFENTYLPLTAFLVAIGSFISRNSPAHVFHFLSALAFSLAPVFWFLLARKVSGRIAPSFGAALLWSLYSLAFPIRRFLEKDAEPLWGSRRLMNIVYFGETPHNLALCLLPLALLALTAYLEKASARRFAVAVVASAAVMLTNAFGLTVFAISSVMLAFARTKPRFIHFVSTGAILLTAYLLICRFLPPSLLELMRVNSPTVDGDFRLSSQTRLLAAIFVAAVLAIAALTRRFSDPTLRFATMFSACFGGIAVIWYARHLGFVPQPHRYDLEMELGFTLVIAFALDAAFQRLPRKVAVVFMAICIPCGCWLTFQDYWFGRHLIHPLKLNQSPPFEQAQWIDAHLSGQRVLVSEYGPWFNLFSNNPQLSAGHEPTAPNRMQRVATYVVYAGAGAGDPDGQAAVFWLKAFGCGALVTQGQAAPSPVSRLDKFDALLPLLKRASSYSIYQVPQQSTSLAHVIPAAATVTRRPIHGMDLDPARAYVSALEDPSLPIASLTWKNPVQGRITANITSGQVISLQETYDVGWRARVSGHPVPIHADGLGMMVIEPNCSGDCPIDIEFTGGTEREICTILGSIVGVVLLILIARPAHSPGAAQKKG